MMFWVIVMFWALTELKKEKLFKMSPHSYVMIHLLRLNPPPSSPSYLTGETSRCEGCVCEQTTLKVALEDFDQEEKICLFHCCRMRKSTRATSKPVMKGVISTQIYQNSGTNTEN